MVDGDDPLDFVKFDRGCQVVPESLMPGLESLCLRGDRGTCNRELAVLTIQIAGVQL